MSATILITQNQFNKIIITLTLFNPVALAVTRRLPPLLPACAPHQHLSLFEMCFLKMLSLAT
jgi:hypothetical protein